MKKLFIACMALFLVGYIVAAPYIATFVITTAISNKDDDSFAAFQHRESLRANLQEQIGKETKRKNYDELLTAEAFHSLIKPVNDEEKLTQKEILRHTKMGYTSLKEFTVTVKLNEEKNVVMHLSRFGVNWKLTEVDLPINSYRDNDS